MEEKRKNQGTGKLQAGWVIWRVLGQYPDEELEILGICESEDGVVTFLQDYDEHPDIEYHWREFEVC